MSNPVRCTAFIGPRLLASGAPGDVAIAVKKALERETRDPVVIFDDATGRQVDFDLRGSDEEIAARLKDLNAPEQVNATRSPGRPKLGVISREVTLLPRHWDWLSQQRGGASAELRRLVDAARKADEPLQAARQAQQAADLFMMAMLGNEANYESAARALYAADRDLFHELSEPWPADLRDHARSLAEPAFALAPGARQA